VVTDGKLGSRYKEGQNCAGGALSDSIDIFRMDIDGDTLSIGRIISTALDSIVLPERRVPFKTALNRVVNFLNRVYALHSSEVVKSDGPPSTFGTYSTVFNFPSADIQSSKNVGLYPVNISGIPCLITAYQESGVATWRGVIYNSLHDVWDSSIQGTLFNTDESLGSIQTEILHRNRIYFLGSDPTTVGIFDPISRQFYSETLSSDSKHPSDFCVLGNRLYVANHLDNKQICLHVLEDGFSKQALVPLGNQSQYPSTSNEYEGKIALWTDEHYSNSSRMYLATPVEDSNGDVLARVIEFTHDANGKATFSRVLGSTNIIIDNWQRPCNAGFGSFTDNIYRAWMDHTTMWTNGGGSPWWILERRDAYYPEISPPDPCTPEQLACSGQPYLGGVDFIMWIGQRWAGPEVVLMSQIGVLDTQPHYSHAHDKFGGGGRIVQDYPQYSDDVQHNIIFKGFSTTIKDHVRINYSIETSASVPNGTRMAVKWYYSPSGHAPQRECNLTSTSHGSIVQKAAFIVADSGTAYWVDWAATSDGIRPFERLNIMGFASITGIDGQLIPP